MLIQREMMTILSCFESVVLEYACVDTSEDTRMGKYYIRVRISF